MGKRASCLILSQVLMPSLHVIAPFTLFWYPAFPKRCWSWYCTLPLPLSFHCCGLIDHQFKFVTVPQNLQVHPAPGSFLDLPSFLCIPLVKPIFKFHGVIIVTVFGIECQVECHSVHSNARNATNSDQQHFLHNNCSFTVVIHFLQVANRLIESLFVADEKWHNDISRQWTENVP